MKIIEIELLNHVVIPESFHIDLRDKSDVICIDGLNGSGKSFLINNIHPLSSSRRFKDKYPIRTGKRGLKRIVYELDSKRELEIIHEYVVNTTTKKHSCKSYCNMITDGVKEELNPTGHTRLFEELIRTHLYFDLDTFVCSFLSPKAESVVSATSTKRKEILQSTIKTSKLIDNVASRNRAQLQESKTTIKLYSKQVEDMLRDLPCKTDEQFENKLSELSGKLSNRKKRTSSLTDELYLLRSDYDKLKETDVSDLEVVDAYVNVLMETGFKDLREGYVKLDESRRASDKLSVQIDSVKNVLEELYNEKELCVDQSALKRLIEELKNEKSRITNWFNERFDLKHIHDIITRFTMLSTSLDSFGESDSEINLSDYSVSGVDKLIEEKEERKNSVKNFIDEFKKHKEMTEGKKGKPAVLLDKRDNCNTCPFYIQNRLSSDFVAANIDKVLKSIDEYEELSADISKLLNVKELVEMFVRTDEYIKRTIGKSIDDLVGEENLLRKVISVTHKATTLSNDLNDLITVYVSESSSLTNVSSELYEAELKLSRASSKSKEVIEKEIETNSKLMGYYKNELQEHIKLIDIFKDTKFMRGSVYDSFDLSSLNTKRTYMTNLKSLLSSKRNEIDEKSRELEESNKDVIEITKSMTYFIEQQKNYNKVSKFLIETKKRETTHQILKDILERRIPLKLLETNISFIEDNVNGILEDNDINLGIDIAIKDTDILIQVQTRNQIVEDISYCSSGELCLLGVVLNAVLMHIIGYTIISFDEMDSNLDLVYREKFHNVVYSIVEKLDIEQVFCVSHNISFDMNVGHIVLGDYDRERLHGEIITY